MRLGQLARKYDIAIEEVISYLKEIGEYHDDLNHNSKLDKDIDAMLAEHFGPLVDMGSVEVEETTEQLDEILEEPINDIEDDQEEPLNELDILLPESEYEGLPSTLGSEQIETESEPVLKESDSVEKNGESIETDELLALLESEESDVDLSHITLIKASKKELTGLKVLGKIELGESKPKSSEEPEEELSDIKSEINSKPEREQLSQDELEEKRVMFKKRREKYEAKQKKLEREKQEEQKKAIKKAHYDGKIKKTKPIQSKKKVKITKTQETLPEVMEQRPKPKTIFGKLWRWLDAPS